MITVRMFGRFMNLLRVKKTEVDAGTSEGGGLGERVWCQVL